MEGGSEPASQGSGCHGEGGPSSWRRLSLFPPHYMALWPVAVALALSPCPSRAQLQSQGALATVGQLPHFLPSSGLSPQCPPAGPRVGEQV